MVSWTRKAGTKLPDLPPPLDADRATSLERLRAQHARLTAQLSDVALTPRGRLDLERLAFRVARAMARFERKPRPAATLAAHAARVFTERADEIDARKQTSATPAAST